MTGGNERRRKIGHLPRQMSNRGPQNAAALLQLINICYSPLSITSNILPMMPGLLLIPSSSAAEFFETVNKMDGLKLP